MPPKSSRVGFAFPNSNRGAATRRTASNTRTKSPAVRRNTAPIFEDDLMDIPAGLTGTSSNFTLPTPKKETAKPTTPPSAPKPSPKVDLSLPTSTRAAATNGNLNPPYLYPDFKCSWKIKVFIIFFSAVFFASCLVNIMPTFINHLDSDHALVTRFIPALPTMQRDFRTPAYTISDIRVEGLRREVARDLSDRVVEFLRRDTPEDAAGFRQATSAFLAAHHSANLYARSRGSNILRHYVLDPALDAWQATIARHDLYYTLWEVVTLRGLWRMPIRVWDGLVCIKQDEKLPCQSLPYHLEQFEEIHGRYPNMKDAAEAREFAYWLLNKLEANH